MARGAWDKTAFVATAVGVCMLGSDASDLFRNPMRQQTVRRRMANVLPYDPKVMENLQKLYCG